VADTAQQFSVVFVCTGNRFRSPLAAAFLQRLTEGLPVVAESYGTLELDGLEALPEAIETAGAYGADIAAHRARPVTRANLAGVDLLIGFEEMHVREAVIDANAPRERSFNLRHFVRLLRDVAVDDDETPIARAGRVVARADELRATLRPTVADNMRDPLGAPPKVQREIAAEIFDACAEIAAVLFGVSDDGALPRPSPERDRRRFARLRFR
jgi:protein-tyrosine-phosphatase